MLAKDATVYMYTEGVHRGCGFMVVGGFGFRYPIRGMASIIFAQLLSLAQSISTKFDCYLEEPPIRQTGANMTHVNFPFSLSLPPSLIHTHTLLVRLVDDETKVP